MKKIYLDTNQLYYIRRIADESYGWDYGNYQWAYRLFPRSTQLVEDIRALCYIVALQYEWELDFSTSDAAFSELCMHKNRRAEPTREAWRIFVQGLDKKCSLKRIPSRPKVPIHGRLSLGFINDAADRAILRHFATEACDVFLTSDGGILQQRERLKELKLNVMRPSEWLDIFLSGLKGSEGAVEWLERIMFHVGPTN